VRKQLRPFGYFGIASLVFCAYVARIDSRKQAVLRGLQIGISLDSAQRLIKNSGWLFDTLIAYPNAASSLFVKYVKLEEIQNSFSAQLDFDSGYLSSIGLTETFMTSSSEGPRDSSDYNRLVALFTSMYGPPSVSAHYFDPTPYSGNQRDTTYWTIWADSLGHIYTVNYDVRYPDLSFASIDLNRPPTLPINFSHSKKADDSSSRK